MNGMEMGVWQAAQGPATNPALAILGIFLLAALVEALVEYLVQPWLKPEHRELTPAQDLVRTMALRYSAAVIGVVLCIAYQVDILALVGLFSGWPLIGPVLTGLLIGRGANFVNDFVERWIRPMVGPPGEPLEVGPWDSGEVEVLDAHPRL
jgi:uncharacterized oligopeptide transporter (OPT) family protein